MTPVGHALDALVAEKVMGEAAPIQPPDEAEAEANHFAGGLYRSPGGIWFANLSGYDSGDKPIWQCRSYSTDIASAWRVVEKVISTTPQKDIHIQHLDGCGWSISCCFDKADGGWDGFVYAPTLPEAICRAALQAVGIPEDSQ